MRCLSNCTCQLEFGSSNRKSWKGLIKWGPLLHNDSCCVCHLGAGGGLCMIREQQSNMLLITMTSGFSLGWIHRWRRATTDSDNTRRHPEPCSYWRASSWASKSPFPVCIFKVQAQCRSTALYVFVRFNVFILPFSPLCIIFDASSWAL